MQHLSKCQSLRQPHPMSTRLSKLNSVAKSTEMQKARTFFFSQAPLAKMTKLSKSMLTHESAADPSFMTTCLDTGGDEDGFEAFDDDSACVPDAQSDHYSSDEDLDDEYGEDNEEVLIVPNDEIIAAVEAPFGESASDNSVPAFHRCCNNARKNYGAFTRDEIRSIKLATSLLKKHASLDTYAEMSRWHYEETGQMAPGDKLGAVPGYISRTSLMNRLAIRYGFKNKAKDQLYNVNPMTLPGTGAKVNLVWHDMRQMVVSLLTDPRITDDMKLHFDDNPLVPPPNEVRKIGDINTGAAYRESYKKYCHNPNRDVLCPIILYKDAAVSGQFDKLPIEALQFTLGIFNNKARVSWPQPIKSGGHRPQS